MGSQPSNSIELIVWRISNYQDVSGRGGLIVSGRWHNHPKTIVYCADAPFTAFCEVVKQVGSELFLPDSYKLLKIRGPRHAAIETVNLEALPANWASDEPDALSACRRVGDEWLSSNRTPLLKAPSAARPGSFNYLLNPVHRTADDFDVIEVIAQPFPGWLKEAPES